jgi:hypothetical protein
MPALEMFILTRTASALMMLYSEVNDALKSIINVIKEFIMNTTVESQYNLFKKI